MSASSTAVPPANVDEHIGQEKNWEEPASEANTMVEKNDNEVDKDSDVETAHPIIPEEDQIAEDEYPSGPKFVFILVALMLSVFMVALDMVRIGCSWSL